MSITEDGISGEKIARLILKKHHFYLFGGDWIIQSKIGNYYLVEVKHKEMFSKMWNGKQTAPFDGQGLDLKQILARQEFQTKTGIRTVFLVIDKITKKVYWNFLDTLYTGEKFQTRNKVVIFPLTNYLNEDELEGLHEC